MTSSTANAGDPDRPIVGAIRWDAWTGGKVTEQVEKTLGPRKYHDRMPWFARVTGDDSVRIDGGEAGVMEKEIAFAADAGLDYWAFVLYAESTPMAVSLGQYLASADNPRIRFCVILHSTLGVKDEKWPAERERVLKLMTHPRYQTVLGGRPLVYCFEANHLGQPAHQRFNEIRTLAKERGHEPYFVFMGWNPAADFKRENPRGFDAVSHYACGGAEPKFANLVEAVEKRFWSGAAQAKVPYVPLVTTGWDKQPRKEHPVSWELGHSYHKQTVFPSTATPKEIADHLARAIAFVKNHRNLCPANAIVMYAWNEHDEGGWLCPTWTASGTPNTARLDAIREVLR